MELELDLDIDRAKAGFLAGGLIIGIIGTLAATTFVSNSGMASQNLVGFLENQSGQELEVVQTSEAGTFYKVDVRTPDNQLSTYYTDGNSFTSNMQNIEEFKQRASQLAGFQQCLSNSGTVMFGNASQRSTQAQIQALGGSQVVAPIYQDVSNNQTLRQVAQLGIQQVPAFYRNQSVIQGTQSVEQVEQFTGCTLPN